MIPNLFVSSTVQDLHHLRELVKATLEELAYNAVLSEHGGVGYLLDSSAEESCYQSVRQCQLAILIVGKRYGSIGMTGRSVTHNEHRAARECQVPVICLVDTEVLTYKKVYDAAPDGLKPGLPGMDYAEGTFALIDEIMGAATNNAILPFAAADDARRALKTQLAHTFGDLLSRRFTPLSSEVRDVLAEVKALRLDLGEKRSDESKRFIHAMRGLLDDDLKYYREVIERITRGDIADAVPALVNSASFDDFVRSVCASEPQVDDTLVEIPPGALGKRLNASWASIVFGGHGVPEHAGKRFVVSVMESGSVTTTAVGLAVLRSLHRRFLARAAASGGDKGTEKCSSRT